MSYRVARIRSSDGTKLAFGYGDPGYPVVLIPAMFGDLQRYPWDRSPPGIQIITADRRGTGMSELEAPNAPPERYVDDLQAIVDHLEFERFAIVGEMAGVAEAVALAARNPERVAHLVLQAPSESLRDFAASAKGQGLLLALDGDWEFFVHALYRSYNWDSVVLGEFARDVAQRWNAKQCRQLIDGLLGIDVEPLMPLVLCPTLVIDAVANTKDGRLSPSEFRTAASGIPQLETVIIDVTDNPDYEVERDRLTYDFIGHRSADPGSKHSQKTTRSVDGDGELKRAGLTEREAGVLKLVAVGMKNREIAEELVVAPSTVANHVRSILAKTRTTTRTEAAAWAIRVGLADK